MRCCTPHQSSVRPGEPGRMAHAASHTRAPTEHENPRAAAFSARVRRQEVRIAHQCPSPQFFGLHAAVRAQHDRQVVSPFHGPQTLIHAIKVVALGSVIEPPTITVGSTSCGRSTEMLWARWLNVDYAGSHFVSGRSCPLVERSRQANQLASRVRWRGARVVGMVATRTRPPEFASGVRANESITCYRCPPGQTARTHRRSIRPTASSAQTDPS